MDLLGFVSTRRKLHSRTEIYKAKELGSGLRV